MLGGSRPGGRSRKHLDLRLLTQCFTDAKRIMLHSHDEHVFFHELGHAADDMASGPLKGGSDPEQEMIAEIVAATLCVMYGFDGYVLQSKRYIEAYGFGELAERDIVRLLSRVGKALDVIFDWGIELASVPVECGRGPVA